MRRNTLLAGLVITFWLPHAPPGWADEATQQVTACIMNNLPTTASVRHLKLTHYDRMNDSREAELQVYARRDGFDFEASAKILAPGNLSGGGFLMRNTATIKDLYVYVPSVGRVRRVVGQNASAATLLGTDINWDDLQLLYSVFSEGDYRLDSTGNYQGREVYRLVFTPSPQRESIYKAVYVDVDRATCVPLHLQALTPGGEVHKQIDVQINSLTHLNGRYWYPKSVDLRDLINQTRTHIQVLSQVQADKRLSNIMFRPDRFYRFR